MSDNSARTDDLEKRTAALEAADELSHSLDENTEALNRVRNKYRLSLLLTALVAVTMALGVKFNYDSNVRLCTSANDLRDEIDAKWDAITLFLEEANVDDDAEGRAFLSLLSEDMVRQDCASINWIGR